ncbi:alpha/beta fold hydrolase [Actinophytocola sediminis]
MAIALSCVVAGVALTGCEEASEATPPANPPASTSTEQELLAGTEKIDVDGRSVQVSCTGELAEGRPVIVLLAGAGDGLEKLAGIQETLSKQDRVCSYDRLGAGKSDQPAGPQDFASSGEVLTAVLDKAAGDHPVVLAGHSLGGLIAARYTPEHQDRVKGLVLVDATPSTAVADTLALVPETAASPAADVRAQMVAMSKGENPELLTIADGEVSSAGDIPVEVLTHGPEFLTAIPEYGPDLERIWSEGQEKWLALSSRSKLSVAERSTHYIYVDQPEIVVEAVQRVAEQAGDQG